MENIINFFAQNEAVRSARSFLALADTTALLQPTNKKAINRNDTLKATNQSAAPVNVHVSIISKCILFKMTVLERDFDMKPDIKSYCLRSFGWFELKWVKVDVWAKRETVIAAINVAAQ